MFRTSSACPRLSASPTTVTGYVLSFTPGAAHVAEEDGIDIGAALVNVACPRANRCIAVDRAHELTFDRARSPPAGRCTGCPAAPPNDHRTRVPAADPVRRGARR